MSKSREFINRLHTEFPESKIRPIKEQIKAGEEIPEDTHTKAEINAITALLIEETWKKTSRDINLEPPGIAIRPEPNLTTPPHVYNLEETEQFVNKFKKQPKELFRFIKNGTTGFVILKFNEWQPDNLQAFNRLETLLKKQSGIPTSIHTPRQHISRGVNTAMFSIWETIAVIPEVYKNQYKRPMQKDEFIKLAQNSLPLIYTIASSHLDVFIEIEPGYTGFTSENNNLKKFVAQNFYYIEKGEDKKLELTEKTLQNINIPYNTETPRTGCPAIYAIGPNKKNVIAEMSDWLIDLANKYYIPNI